MERRTNKMETETKTTETIEKENIEKENIEKENIEKETIEKENIEKETIEKKIIEKKTIKNNKKIERQLSLQYCNEKPYQLMITVFNNKTYSINRAFADKMKYPCIYSSPVAISNTILPNTKLFIIEMNNEINRVMGIGYIKNNHCTKRIYEDEDDTTYNGNTYRGLCHIVRDEQILFQVLDRLCFYGTTHLKRSNGITRFPVIWQYRLREKGEELSFDIVSKIQHMFKKKIQESNQGKEN